MSVDHLNPKYPEHLNPFRRSSNTLTRSFRGIKNAIVRSFTGKEKDRPVIRPKQGTESTNRAVFSMPPSYKEPPIAFPRSRFSERLSKTDAIRASTLNKKSIWTGAGQNPFDDGDENAAKGNRNISDDSLLTPPKPATRSKYKRRKKKAPIPPGSVSGSVSGSKWSLDSTESDMSSMCFYSETEIDFMDRSTGDNEEILSLTRQIAKFTGDTNNNNIRNDSEDSKTNENIPETSKTETDSSNRSDLTAPGNENVSITITDENGADKAVDNQKIGSTNGLNQNVLEEAQIQNDEIPQQPTEAQSSNEEASFSTSINLNPSASREDTNSNQNQPVGDTSLDLNPSVSNQNQADGDNALDLNPSALKEEMTPSQSQVGDPSLDSNPSVLKEEIIPSQSQLVGLDRSISNESLNESVLDVKDEMANNSFKIEENVIRVTMDGDTLEATDRRVSVKGTIEFFENATPSPTAKIRKNILTKENLLGSDGI